MTLAEALAFRAAAAGAGIRLEMLESDGDWLVSYFGAPTPGEREWLAVRGIGLRDAGRGRAAGHTFRPLPPPSR